MIFPATISASLPGVPRRASYSLEGKGLIRARPGRSPRSSYLKRLEAHSNGAYGATPEASFTPVRLTRGAAPDPRGYRTLGRRFRVAQRKPCWHVWAPEPITRGSGDHRGHPEARARQTVVLHRPRVVRRQSPDADRSSRLARLRAFRDGICAFASCSAAAGEELLWFPQFRSRTSGRYSNVPIKSFRSRAFIAASRFRRQDIFAQTI